MKPPSHAACPEERTQRAHGVRRVTVVGLGVNLLLSAGKYVLGVAGNSQALVADAVHSLSDCATDLIVIFGAPIWSAPADENHPYGHGRIETLVTLVIGVVLGAAGIGIAWRAVGALGEADASVPGWTAFAGACGSIVAKEALYQWTMRRGLRLKSPALMANAWHHRSDALSSLPVALAVLGSRLNPAWHFLDPVGAIIVALMILQATWKIVRPALDLLVDHGASTLERENLQAIAEDTEGVVEVHALRTRHVGSGLSVDLHVMVNPELSVREGHRIAGMAKARLLEHGPDVVDVLVHLEPYEDEPPPSPGP